ncbi:TPA: hypothetical protein ACH3X1_002740 [Trebouxia sp. C0004]
MTLLVKAISVIQTWSTVYKPGQHMTWQSVYASVSVTCGNATVGKGPRQSASYTRHQCLLGRHPRGLLLKSSMSCTHPSAPSKTGQSSDELHAEKLANVCMVSILKLDPSD